MEILISGATELGIREQYIAELKAIQVQQVSSALRLLAVHYLYLVTSLFRLKVSWLVRSLSWVLWRAYVPSTCTNPVKRLLGDVFTAVLLLPGASLGALIRLYLLATGTPPSPMLAALVAPKRPPKTTATPSQPQPSPQPSA